MEKTIIGFALWAMTAASVITVLSVIGLSA